MALTVLAFNMIRGINLRAQELTKNGRGSRWRVPAETTPQRFHTAC